MQCYPIQVSEVRGLIQYIKSNREKYDDVLRLIRKVETAFELPELHLVTKTGRTGRPTHYKGTNIPEIRRALFVYLNNEAGITSTHLEKWFGYDHSNYIKAVKKGMIFLKNNDPLFMVYYDFVRGLANDEEMKIAV